MTILEHRFLLELFSQQTRVMKSLVEVLRSQGFVKQGDLEAYDALVEQNESVQLAIRRLSAEQYLNTAKTYGVKVGFSVTDLGL